MESASKAVGPYSPGARGGALLFASGQTSLDSRGNVIGIGDAGVQTVETLKNLTAFLAAAGATLDSVVKTTVFLSDMRHYAAMNEAYAKFFPKDRPARSTVLAPLALPELLVEIEAVAVLED
ncbi:MAG: RidA family protein [Candidatus Tectomicrobia bacterium]|nr:RidA family protein [Candidatus Tectomicrobia bacterium]